MTFSVISRRTRITVYLVSSVSLMGLQHIVQNFQSGGKREPSQRGVGASRNAPLGLKESIAWRPSTRNCCREGLPTQG